MDFFFIFSSNFSLLLSFSLLDFPLILSIYAYFYLCPEVQPPRTCCAGIPLNFPSSVYPCLIIFTHFSGLWWLGWMSRGKTKKSRVVEYLRRVNWHLFRQNKNIPSSFTKKLLINNPSICFTFTHLSHLGSSFILSALLRVLSCPMWHFINSKSLRHLFADTASNFVDNKPDCLQGRTGRGRCSEKVSFLLAFSKQKILWGLGPN